MHTSTIKYSIHQLSSPSLLTLFRLIPAHMLINCLISGHMRNARHLRIASNCFRHHHLTCSSWAFACTHTVRPKGRRIYLDTVHLGYSTRNQADISPHRNPLYPLFHSYRHARNRANRVPALRNFPSLVLY